MKPKKINLKETILLQEISSKMSGVSKSRPACFSKDEITLLMDNCRELRELVFAHIV